MIFYELNNSDILFHYSKKLHSNNTDEDNISSVTIYENGRVVYEQYKTETDNSIVQETFTLSNNDLKKINEIMIAYDNELNLYLRKMYLYHDNTCTLAFKPNITEHNNDFSEHMFFAIVRQIIHIVKNSENKYKSNLEKKQVAEHKNKDKIGETNIATNGQQMRIIAYHNLNNIDVEFEDGVVVTNKTYQAFKSGQIRNPTVSCNRKERTGETNIAINGQKITIVAYRRYNDIDVQFEDGTIVYNRTYAEFLTGKIEIYNNKIGEKGIATNGQIMTIIAYRRSDDIDVQFEDGTIVKNKTYHSFHSGQIRNPNMNLNGIKHIGQTNIATNGQQMKIIAYRNKQDIDIEFEDGTVVTNKKYSNFLIGKIKNYNANVGETNISKNGQQMKIIAYHGANDIDVQFEDGTIVTQKTYQNFKNGTISNPNYEFHKKNIKKNSYP